MDIKQAQSKGFGSHGGLVNRYFGDVEPLGKRVLVEGMHFGETKTKGGLILVDDDGTQEGIHPRWAKVYAIGKRQEDVKVGQWILVSHGRWSRALKVKKDNSSKKVIGIEEINKLLNGELNLIEVKERIFIKTRQYAKRQTTWARGQMMSWQKIEYKNQISALKKFE